MAEPKYLIHLEGAEPLVVNDDLRIASGVGPADVGGRLVGFVNPHGDRAIVSAVKALEDPSSVNGWEPSIGSRAQIFGWGYLVAAVEVIEPEPEPEPEDG